MHKNNAKYKGFIGEEYKEGRRMYGEEENTFSSNGIMYGVFCNDAAKCLGTDRNGGFNKEC